MTTETLALLVTAALCVVAIAGVIVGVCIQERGNGETDEHEETDQCRN